VSSYLPHARLALAPVLLRMQPSSLSEALRFIERVKACFEAGLPARDNALQEAEALQQVRLARRPCGQHLGCTHMLARICWRVGSRGYKSIGSHAAFRTNQHPAM
jgi:hypothetical protein